jgi:hypothetical protein
VTPFKPLLVLSEFECFAIPTAVEGPVFRHTPQTHEFPATCNRSRPSRERSYFF